MTTLLAPGTHDVVVVAPASSDRRVAIAVTCAALLTALLLAALPLFFATPAAHEAAHRPRRAPMRALLPALPAPPPVEPTVYADLTPDQARLSNAIVPFEPGTPPLARPFVYPGSAADRAAALTCLSAAVLYEAGDDAPGEQAVAQVVLNRLRHPAFPKTVCGVVFQGAERTTGCQFTFTCDGSLARPPAPAAWDRARAIADAALSGHVDAAVGTATHYHTDWVVPYWRESLAKIAKVHTQIFYRWPGAWGETRAFAGRAQPLETLDPRLVALAGPEAMAADAEPDMLAAAPDPDRAPVAPSLSPAARVALDGAVVRLADADAHQFVLRLSAATPRARDAAAAAALCRDAPNCMEFGWLDDAQMPRALPIAPRGLRGMTFLYRKLAFTPAAEALWNCRQVPRAMIGACLPGTG